MKTILYITFIDFGDFSSGSSMRPQMMYKAFEQIGLQVKLLSGSQANVNREQRRKNVEEIHRWLDDHTPDLCYIEPNVDPIINRFDLRLIQRVHKMGVPISFFMRDTYYKLGKEFMEPQKGLRQRLRTLYINALHARDERMLRSCVDLVYFPTKLMASYFSFARTDALPPAGENFLPEAGRERGVTGIYVGGLSPAYGSRMLMESYDILNRGQQNCLYKLIVVCRENELRYIEPYRNAPWLEVCHASGSEQLTPLYRRADVALIPRMKSLYNDITISIKLFEYMGYGLPVVLADSKSMSEIVKRYEIGIITGHKPEEFALGVRQMLDDGQRYSTYVHNVRTALLSSNLWTHRAQKVVDDLLEDKT